MERPRRERAGGGALTRLAWCAAVAAAVAVAVASSWGSFRRAAREARTGGNARGPVLRVPRAAGPIALDGEVDDACWRGAHASTGFFPSVDGERATDSEVRVAWGSGKLYFLLFAADADIRSSVTTRDAPLWPEDAFRLDFGPPDARKVLWIAPNGALTDGVEHDGELDTSWQSGAEIAHDVDGTPNDPRDDDEEWVIEMSVPLAALGLRGEPGEHVAFGARRCDAPKGARRRCAAWGDDPRAPGEIVLE